MPPAARVTDVTTHGAPLAPGPGSTDVLIGGMPAWRALMDQHACPLVSITGADGVGMVMMGSPTVLIDFMMACRMGDIVVEVPGLVMGPMNPIILGCPTVMIGEVGIPAPPGAVGMGGVAAGLAVSGATQAQASAQASSPPAPAASNAPTSAALTPTPAPTAPADTPQDRLNTAKAFYDQTGWSDERIANHLRGIDFNQPVEVVTLHPGDVVKQWVDPKSGVGGYFDADAQPEELGICPTNVVPRELKTFVVSQETKVLKSTAAGIKIDWLKGVPPIYAKGGASQLFALPKDKSSFVPGGVKL